MAYVAKGTLYSSVPGCQLHYQLLHEDGRVVSDSVEYKGEAHYSFDRKRIVLGSLMATHLNLFVIGDPTPDSVETQRGYDHGMKQRRKVCGRSWSENFRTGWQRAWEDRDEGRAERRE